MGHRSLSPGICKERENERESGRGRGTMLSKLNIIETVEKKMKIMYHFQCIYTEVNKWNILERL